ncbi:MAG: sel1 repeat family protein [Gammaproteobacteria bacterium]|nr:sel1 repeat family protein [Gammaproteobacteria bacterium]NNJ49347.1 sel1 repeat family protein [Gammaproteobacteria bacterium]
MKQIKIFIVTFLLTITCITFPITAGADELVSQSSNIFKFQQKLAMNGNVHAQYKLASMYETGDGVTADIKQAKHWYSRAAEAGSKPAMHRSTYLEAKEKGFDPAKDADWLNSVKTEAGAHKAEAMFLLGQLYGEGIGVKKDLLKSLELLKQVRILGVANVDKQIAFIQNEIDQQNKSEQRKKVVRSKENLRLKQASETQLATQQADTEQQAKQKAEAEKLAQAEKIRRYEKAMMQLKMEQQLIDRQQEWASGGDVASADDEI